MTDLQRLIEAAEAGGGASVAIFSNALGKESEPLIVGAYHGSLDAAKALHGALLPGSSAVIQTNGTVQTISPFHDRHVGVCEDNPARAWLIAILRAVEAGR